MKGTSVPRDASKFQIMRPSKATGGETRKLGSTEIESWRTKKNENTLNWADKRKGRWEKKGVNRGLPTNVLDMIL